jgi:RNA polymerase-binding transcription factor DksA
MAIKKNENIDKDALIKAPKASAKKSTKAELNATAENKATKVIHSTTSASDLPSSVEDNLNDLQTIKTATPLSTLNQLEEINSAEKETTESKVAAPKKAPAKKSKSAEEKKAAKPIVIPKLTTTAAKKYEPDFMKSILDKKEVEAPAYSQRYSDVDLNEFKELISGKLDAAKKELTYLHGMITRKGDMAGDETDNRYMTMEDGSLSMEREQLNQMASRQIDFIDKLEKAMIRIENKTYGICRETGKLIEKARLRAVPHATLSMEAKMNKNR